MPASPFRILIADDHEALCRGVRSLLESEGAWQVVGEAHDGREALRLTRELKPDIAILDYSLPQMNGLELTRAIKAELPRTQILIYSMHESETIVSDVLQAGARGYVFKTDGGDQLLAAVTAMSQRKPYFSGSISETLINTYIEGRPAPVRKMLTARERQVIQLIAEGQTNKQVAYILGLAAKTVETHRAAAMHKLKISTTAELVLYAVRNDIVLP